MVSYRLVRRNPPAKGVYILRLPDHVPHPLGRDVSEPEAKKIAATLNKEAKAMAKKTKKKTKKKTTKKRSVAKKAPKRKAAKRKAGKRRSKKKATKSLGAKSTKKKVVVGTFIV